MSLAKTDLNLFLVFDAVYEERNLTRAARLLHITQPAVSNALKRLRLAFNDPLFVRTPRGVAPTPVAENIVGQVKEALNLLTISLSESERFLPRRSEKVFALGVHDIDEAVLVPRLMERLEALAPSVSVECISAPRDELERELASGTLDFRAYVVQRLSAGQRIDYLICDEAQFYTEAQIDQLATVVDELGIDVSGKIVLMRYSEPYSYRGYKVYFAESRGAVGAIIYSDPEDDGYGRGETYPHGPWGPPSHIQWGAIVYDWFGSTPFTFHWKKQRGGRWVESGERDRRLPKIPSIPMSHEAAAEILSRLGGPGVPPAWQGGLPFAYHVGPGPVRVHLRVDNDEHIGTMRNVIGRVRGAEQPERWVVIGNHRDAWIYGAYDPSSGTAALLEVARAFGAALEAGHRPK